MPERIVSAALTVYGIIVSLPPPVRHHTIIAAVTELRQDLKLDDRSQGFLTSTGRYVSWIEAGEIALEALQVAALTAPPRLFSEDLW